MKFRALSLILSLFCFANQLSATDGAEASQKEDTSAKEVREEASAWSGPINSWVLPLLGAALGIRSGQVRRASVLRRFTSLSSQLRADRETISFLGSYGKFQPKAKSWYRCFVESPDIVGRSTAKTYFNRMSNTCRTLKSKSGDWVSPVVVGFTGGAVVDFSLKNRDDLQDMIGKLSIQTELSNSKSA